MGAAHDPRLPRPRAFRVRPADTGAGRRPNDSVSSFRAVGDHLAIDLPGARAMFTTRRGGVSTGPYESLNLGRWTDDEPQVVERNRTQLSRSLGVTLAYGRQVHRSTVHH